MKFSTLKKQNKHSGFTLLELLIVIAIIAILSVALVIVLNPSEALKKSRDSQRMSDLATLKTAIGIYTVNTPSPNMAGASNAGCKGTASDEAWTNSDFIYYSYPSETSITDTTLDGATFTTGGASQVSSANLGLNTGSGWLPINFSSISGGSPISSLPVDPVNTIADPAKPTSSDLVYRYICLEKNLTYEIDATLESEAYTITDNKMTKDGGNNDLYYEVGTNLGVFNEENSALVAIGDTYQGGIVAYILQTGDSGYDTNVQHGIIATQNNQSTGIFWHSVDSDVIGTTSTIIGSGNTNTVAIMGVYGTENNAAKLCSDLNLGDKLDWYLPSKDELNKLYENRSFVGGFINDEYWTSTEYNSWYAWKQNMVTGGQYQTGGKSSLKYVRCVRSF